MISVTANTSIKYKTIQDYDVFMTQCTDTEVITKNI